MVGRALSDAQCVRLWEAWTPAEVAPRMASVAAPWYVAAGWALDLFTGAGTRAHGDLEIGVPRARFGEVVAAFPDFEWDVVGDGRIWPFPEQAARHHQTWLREPATGQYRVDVFREPHVGDRWVCRRDESITLPYDELILHTRDAIPYAIPEVALLFKAKALRDKDEADFQRVLLLMDRSRGLGCPSGCPEYTRVIRGLKASLSTSIDNCSRRGINTTACSCNRHERMCMFFGLSRNHSSSNVSRLAEHSPGGSAAL